MTRRGEEKIQTGKCWKTIESVNWSLNIKTTQRTNSERTAQILQPFHLCRLLSPLFSSVGSLLIQSPRSLLLAIYFPPTGKPSSFQTFLPLFFLSLSPLCLSCFRHGGSGFSLWGRATISAPLYSFLPLMLFFARVIRAAMANASASPGGDPPESGEGSPQAPVRDQDRFLPIANIGRIMKKALPNNAKIAKDAKETMQECVSEFVSFITSEYGLFFSPFFFLILCGILMELLVLLCNWDT